MNANQTWTWAVIAAIVLAFGHDPACADSVEISGGGHATGKVVRKNKYVLVEIDPNLQVAIPDSRVRSVVPSEKLATYQRNAEKAGDNAELHYQLARWCGVGDNVPGRNKYYKQLHMQRAIELDPDHAFARAWLGYKKHQGKWIRTSDLMRDRGMVSVGGAWRLPEAVALEDGAEEVEKRSKIWIQDVKNLIGIAMRPSARNNKAAEALQTLAAIDDPLAATAIAKQLDDSRGKNTQSVAMRRMWVTLLGRFRNSVSVQALVRAGIDEPDNTIREAALEQLVQYGSASARATYTPMLRANNNALVNRAARALSWFPDPEQAMTYVDALVTTTKTADAPGPAMQVGVGNNGVGGMSMGNRQTVRADTRTNPAVLTLVKEIEPSVDYGFDEAQWKAHFAAQKTAFSGDLRRDP